MRNCIPADIIPIHWFGDRMAYNKSKVKVVTVGLNPSNKEFRERDGDPYSTSLRFPTYKEGNANTLTSALNAYFKTNPYGWFKAFENVLNGMGASYYDNDNYPCRALHTDICSPWATDPTWSKLPQEKKEALYAEGHPQWLNLIAALKPDIIVASVSSNYIAKLGIENTKTEFCRFEHTKDGSKRKIPEIVWKYNFKGIPLINGRTRHTPFGNLSNEFRQTIGEKIREHLLT